jgi:hypothetical protein
MYEIWWLETSAKPFEVFILFNKIGGQDSSVGIATPYGLDGPGIESRWGARFSAPVQTGPAVFRGGKAAGAWCLPPTPIFSAEVLNWVELYFYLP